MGEQGYLASMRRHVSITGAALLLLLALSLSIARDASAEVDAYDGEEDGQEEASNSVGLEYDDDYDPAVGEGRAVFDRIIPSLSSARKRDRDRDRKRMMIWTAARHASLAPAPPHTKKNQKKKQTNSSRHGFCAIQDASSTTFFHCDSSADMTLRFNASVPTISRFYVVCV